MKKIAAISISLIFFSTFAFVENSTNEYYKIFVQCIFGGAILFFSAIILQKLWKKIEQRFIPGSWRKSDFILLLLIYFAVLVLVQGANGFRRKIQKKTHATSSTGLQKLFELEKQYEKQLNEKKIEKDLKEIFKKKNLPLTGKITVVKKADDKWIICSQKTQKVPQKMQHSHEYIIYKEKTKLVVYIPTRVELFLMTWIAHIIYCAIIILNFRLSRQQLGLTGFSFSKFLASIASYILYIPWIVLALSITHYLHSLFGKQAQAQKIVQSFFELKGIQWWLAAATATIAAPVFEEMIYRVFLYSSLRETFGVKLGILISSVMFAIMHYEPNNAYAILPVFALGVLFAILYEKTQSFWVPAIAHACHNTISLICLLQMGNM